MTYLALRVPGEELQLRLGAIQDDGDVLLGFIAFWNKIESLLIESYSRIYKKPNRFMFKNY